MCSICGMIDFYDERNINENILHLLGNIYCSEEDGIYKEKLDKLIKNIKHEFERLINTSRSLSLEDASDEKPAGLDKIDEWIKEIKDQVSNPDDYKKYLLESPKGLIVSGIPGSGKSMMAKYIAHNLGLSLLRFDIGNVGGKYVGDSEKNMDEALELIDTLTPCVLWIDEIEKALQSERVLMKLLGIASGVCIFITLFGIFSMVSLTCERRRKEMAIRKVHGAKIRDIIGLFVKEYGILLLVSAAVAFSVGYAVMKQWLQTYVIQTTISWWIYVAILAAVTLMIVLCVGYRVWKAANENPADVVKSE